ncbi:MAG TPA: MFS transporter, partial [Micromonosporaceae bacterium]
AIAGVVAGVGAINVLEVFFVRDTLGASTTAFGVVTAMWTAGMLAGAWVFAGTVRRISSEASLVLVMLLLLAGCCAMVLAAAGVPAVGWLVPLWLFGGLLNGGMGVFQTVVVARRVPAEARGRAFAAIEGTVQGAAMLGYLLGGALLELFAPRPLVAACGIAGLLAVAAVVAPVLRAGRAERDGRSPTLPDEPDLEGGPAEATSVGTSQPGKRDWPLSPELASRPPERPDTVRS